MEIQTRDLQAKNQTHILTVKGKLLEQILSRKRRFLYVWESPQEKIPVWDMALGQTQWRSSTLQPLIGREAERMGYWGTLILATVTLFWSPLSGNRDVAIKQPVCTASVTPCMFCRLLTSTFIIPPSLPSGCVVSSQMHPCSLVLQSFPDDFKVRKCLSLVFLFNSVIYSHISQAISVAWQSYS